MINQDANVKERYVYKLKDNDTVFVTAWDDFFETEDLGIKISEYIGTDNFDFRFSEPENDLYTTLNDDVVSKNGVLTIFNEEGILVEKDTGKGILSYDNLLEAVKEKEKIKHSTLNV